MSDILLYTDGGARGNPGPAGAGVVALKAGETLFELKRFLGAKQTNNWAEYEALIMGIQEIIKKGFEHETIEVRMDSELVVRQIAGEYKVKEPSLKEQYKRASDLMSQCRNIHVVHVRRAENARADLLVNEAIDESV